MILQIFHDSMVDFNNTGSFNFDKFKYMKQKCSIKIATRIMIHNFEVRYLRIVYANVYNGKYYKIKKGIKFLNEIILKGHIVRFTYK